MRGFKSLRKKIKKKDIVIGVIGLGYVGLPLAVLLANKGFRVLGFLRHEEKAKQLNRGENYLKDLAIEKDLKQAIKKGFLQVKIINEDHLKKCEVFLICVPTPVNKEKKPDLSALRSVAGYLKRINLSGKLIINESTVAPFTTKKLLGGLGGDYFLTCSPERIDPGNKTKTLKNIPKVIGGIDKESLLLAKALYKQILKGKLIEVSNLETAEMSKMLENTYRAVNIALINELALLCEKVGIDILEVIEAAKTKWSFQAHYPSIGVGGHCIPVDPYYLLEMAKKKKVKLVLISDALKRNEDMPNSLLKKFLKIYQKGRKVLVYGLTYKKDVKDLRESPVLTFCQLLKEKNINFRVYDPYLSVKEIGALGLQSGSLEKTDVFVVGTDHHQLAKDYLLSIGRKTIVIDGRNFFQRKIGKKVVGVGRILS